MRNKVRREGKKRGIGLEGICTLEVGNLGKGKVRRVSCSPERSWRGRQRRRLMR